MQNVLDSLVPALLADKNRKFIYVEQATPLPFTFHCRRYLVFGFPAKGGRELKFLIFCFQRRSFSAIVILGTSNIATVTYKYFNVYLALLYLVILIMP